MSSLKLAFSVCFLCTGLVLADDPKTDPKAKDKLPAADFKLTPAELRKEFDKNLRTANEKYAGKIVELSGKVSRAGLAFGTKNSSVTVETPSTDSKVMFGPSIECLNEDPEFFAQFGHGQTVRIKGKVRQFGGALESCEVVEKGEDTRITITTGALAKEFTEDRKKAQEKYNQKTLVVTGKITAIKPSPGLKTKYLEVTGDGKTVVECRYMSPDLIEKCKVGEEVKLYGMIALVGQGPVKVSDCYPLTK